MKTAYRTHLIITRSLYISNPVFESQKRLFKGFFSENSGLMYGYYSRAERAKNKIFTTPCQSMTSLGLSFLKNPYDFISMCTVHCRLLKFRYSEKATKLEKIFHLKFDATKQIQILSEIFFSNFVAFSEYPNFTYLDCYW